MKRCYINRRFSETSRQTIDTANRILEDYARQGYNLTLRQLYYQFVSKGLIDNQDGEYKRLGSVINDARLAGLVDWDHITDRTRNLRTLPHWDDPQSVVEACASQFRVDKWSDQANYIEVWVEKDALMGILQVACEPLDVPFFSCRGYTSQSEMWVAAMRIVRQLEAGKAVTLIHLGDHDPSGIDMSRDIEERIRLFVTDHVGDSDSFTLKRIALNFDQIEQYTPPPNPAKLTDSRANAYIARFGHESWELDALEPTVINRLISDEVLALRDVGQWEVDLEKERIAKSQLSAVARDWHHIILRKSNP